MLASGELNLPPGSTVALIGANGAGKSTLLSAIAGSLPIPVGTAELRMDDIVDPPVAYLPQNPALPGWLTVGESAAMYGISPQALVAGLPGAGLEELAGRSTRSLSGGEHQLAAVAITLAGNRAITLLDEPFSGLDVRRRQILAARIMRRRSEWPGGVTIISSHEASGLYTLCDWIVVIREHEYAFQGSRDALLDLETPAEADASLDSVGRFESCLAALTG